MENLTENTRRCIIPHLLAVSSDSVLPRSALTNAAKTFHVDKATVGRLWHRYKTSVASGVEGGDWSSHMSGRVGRKPLDRAELATRIRAVPFENRQSQMALAEATGILRALVAALLKEGAIHRHTNKIKPTLTEENKLQRLEFSLSFLDENTLEFDPFYDVVHIDEKWFNKDTDRRSYFLLADEDAPIRTRKSKRFIPKTMFLAAVARPRYDPHRKTMFDGKIGLWPLTEDYVAQRSSKNRSRGTICIRNVETVDRKLYKYYLVHHVIPAIKQKWPLEARSRVIIIQQDNAKPHVSPSDPEVVAAGTSGGWNIRMLCQPPNSPDLNVLDLVFFASIQSIQYRHVVHDIEELIRVVQEAFDTVNFETLDNIFITLATVMNCVLEDEGGNTYMLPHIGKAKRRRKGENLVVVKCSGRAFEMANASLEKAGRAMLF